MAEGMKREFSATARNLRMSARKARLVMDAVRGRGADEAMVLLQFVNRRAAPAIRKLIQSAVANAEEYGNRNGIDIETDSLVVAEARVDEGPRMKRWRPRSRGMANPFTRYTCHIHVTVAEPEYLEEKAKGKPAWRKPRQRLSREQRLIKTGRMQAPVEQQAEAKAEAAPKAEKKPARKAEAKPEKKAEKKSEKKPAKKTEKKAEKKSETKSAKKSDKKK
ncbi:MAG: 50S ribosomal protein L22 [Planctomycetota bacterium]|nr:50S ribosomal protein L22 [Planctomycetota bacterium]